MKSKAVFFHAGCPVCVDAQNAVEALVDRTRYDLEIVHLGENRDRLGEAERAGVNSVPALVADGYALHLNHGADLAALR